MANPLASTLAEIWVLYLLGAAMIGARVFCRTKMAGFRNYQLDDYLVIIVACIWTTAPIIGQVFIQVAQGRHTSDLTQEQREYMDDTERKKWAYGSQIFLVGLINYFLIVWILKFNMLCFYSRVVRHLWTEKFVKPLMVIVILSGIAILFTITLNCRPFRHYWQVWPDPGRQCAPQNVTVFVVMLSFNIFTDICIMLIPIPVLAGFKATLWKKVGIFFLFTLGFFCMIAAILRFVLIFNQNQRGGSAMWSTREDCVAIIVGQAPLVTPLLRRKFWVEAGYATPKPGTFTYGDTSKRYRGDNRDIRQAIPISSEAAEDGFMSTLPAKSDSQEEIVGMKNLPSPPERMSNAITVHKRVGIEEGPLHMDLTRDARW